MRGSLGKSDCMGTPSHFDNLRHQIDYLSPAALLPRKGSARTHPPKQLEKIRNSILRFGFVEPVLIDEQSAIVAGDARVKVALQLGLRTIPAIRLQHLSPAEYRALALAANRIAEDAGWDNVQLAIELRELSLDSEFDLTVIGFETGEIDLLIGEAVTATEDAPLPTDRSVPAISNLGDMYRFGDHYLLCGNGLAAESYQLLLQHKRAQMVFTDPPYNLEAKQISGLGKRVHGDFLQASGELSSQEFTQFLAEFGRQTKAFSQKGAVVFVCMDWRHTFELQNALTPTFGPMLNQCVWVKTNGGMGSLWRSQYELVLVFKNGNAAHINNVQLGQFGRNRTNVWHYAGASSFGKGRDEALEMHPTVKPVGLVADAILDCSHRGGIILDPFVGSGTIFCAAQRTGRKGYGIELDPYYVDIALARFQRNFGIEAIHVQSGLAFSQLQKSRQRDNRRSRRPKRGNQQGEGS